MGGKGRSDFEKNAVKGGARPALPEEGNRSRPPADTAEYIAQKIVDVIKTGEAEVYAHDWMKEWMKR